MVIVKAAADCGEALTPDLLAQEVRLREVATRNANT